MIILGRSVTSAVSLLVIGNLLATFGDVSIKSAGHDIPIFQFIFIRVICTVLLLLPFYRMVAWSNVFVGSRVHFIRGNIWVLATVLLVLSLQLLPLSTANAIFYTVPILIIVLSTVFFRESLTPMIVLVVISGFLGILIILRPTEISWGALYALAFSFLLAISSVLIRKLPKGQSLVHGLWMTCVFALPLSFALYLWEGEPFNVAMLGYVISSSICSIGYAVASMAAYRYIAANRITSAEYTGLIFAVLAGWLLFDEEPDIWFALGAVFIIVPVYLLGRTKRKIK